MNRFLTAFVASATLLSPTVLGATLLGAPLWLAPASAQTPTDILNVSYDVSRELYDDINKAFKAKYKADTGTDVTINQCRMPAPPSRRARCSKASRPMW